MANRPGPKGRRGFEDEPQSALRDLLSEEEVEEPEDLERVLPRERRSFADLLRTTPPAALGPFEKFGLIAVAVVVALLFAVSLWALSTPRG